ncbi:hypothetical protein [Marilutibacter alkalisoli]|uniref:Sodium:proline symporter n=1 Tax=Marilutibacter alkalisoli TaxID=2591633 RepID=A0A514BS02_9GAMM|nr:hypothetical protein [Lysobacter alkalisoli]QDH69799.1 hypothetical protein FKV23_06590 [Lysobacter alkalisoli]
MPTTFDHFDKRDHRLHLTVPGAHISMKAVACAAVAAGIVFLALELILTPLLMGLSSWVPMRMIAAITMGHVVLPPPDTFDSSAVSAAVVVHFLLSLIYALVFALIAKGRSLATDTVLGAVFGLVLYGVNYYGFTYLFPWFIEMRHWVSALIHLVSGGVLGLTYALAAARFGPLPDHPVAGAQ